MPVPIWVEQLDEAPALVGVSYEVSEDHSIGKLLQPVFSHKSRQTRTVEWSFDGASRPQMNEAKPKHAPNIRGMLQTTRIAFTLLAFALLAAACSQDQAVDTTSATTTTLAPATTLAPSSTVATTPTTTVPPATTTTIHTPEVFDTVNGLEPDSDDLMNRRTVTVKIDNQRLARPQSGTQEADLVYEMLVEAGLTRFAFVFHQSDLDWVGPVRSGRVTDLGALRWMDGLVQVSGAQPWVQDILREGGLRVVYDSGRSTFRESHRKAPHNLYASTFKLRDQANDAGWPDENPGNVFDFGIPTEGDAEATEIRFDWSSSPDVVWRWNGDVYERYNEDVPHTWVTEDTKNDTGEIVTTPTLVVITGRKHFNHDPTGWGSSIPTTETKGEGEAYVFAEGTVIEGRWQRDSYADKFNVTATDGTPIVLHPSRMWIIIFPDNRELTWE
jgi:hypothetical protein